MARRHALLVASFFLLKVASVQPRATQNVAQTEEILSNLSYEPLESDQEKVRSFRVIRGLPGDDDRYVGPSVHQPTKEQQAAAAKQEDKQLREKQELATQQIKEAKVKLGLDEAAERRRGYG